MPAPPKGTAQPTPLRAKVYVRDDFTRGYFCAVAVALREHGDTTVVRSMFSQGGDPLRADTNDIALFREHGLMV